MLNIFLKNIAIYLCKKILLHSRTYEYCRKVRYILDSPISSNVQKPTSSIFQPHVDGRPSDGVGKFLSYVVVVSNVIELPYSNIV